MNGNNILVYLDGTAIAGLRSNELQTEADVVEIASPTTGAWRSHIAGRKEWSVSAGWLVTVHTDIAKALSVGTSYTLRFGFRDGSGLSGSAILTTCNITATRGNLVQGSFQFKGCGALQTVSGSVI